VGWSESAPARGEWNISKENIILYTSAVVLIILWLLDMVTSYTMGGFIYVLLVIPAIMIIFNLLSDRKRV
jgi:hypothetical protein